LRDAFAFRTGLRDLTCFLEVVFVFGLDDADFEVAFEAAGRVAFGAALDCFAAVLCLLAGFVLEEDGVSLGLGGLRTGSDLRIFRDLRLLPLYTRT